MKRNTIQNQLVLNAVKELKNHPTADEVYEKVVKIHPTISKGTVYRNLNVLVEEGLLIKIAVPDSADRFDHTLKKHYHIKCIKCGRVEDIDLSYMDDLDKKVEKVSKFKVLGQEVMFKGLCDNCIE